MSSVLTESGSTILTEDGTAISVEDIPGMITPNDLRAHIETDLTDGELQKVIDAETEYLDSYAPTGTIVEEFTFETPTKELVLRRPAASITQIQEGDSQFSYTVVDAAQYKITADGHVIRNGYFLKAVQVTYVAVLDAELRESVLTDLAKLRLLYQYGINTSAGDFGVLGSMQSLDKERAKITRRLRVRRWA